LKIANDDDNWNSLPLHIRSLTVLLLSNLVLNLIFLLMPITSSHPHASTSDSTFDYWCYINISLTLTLYSVYCMVPVSCGWGAS